MPSNDKEAAARYPPPICADTVRFSRPPPGIISRTFLAGQVSKKRRCVDILEISDEYPETWEHVASSDSHDSHRQKNRLVPVRYLAQFASMELLFNMMYVGDKVLTGFV